MQSVRSALTAGAGPCVLLRNLSSLASGQVLTGAKWNYRVIDALVGDGTHKSGAFKAEVLPKDGALDAPQWAFIKTAAPDDLRAKENLKREYESYLLPSIASGECFRKMYEVIGDPLNIGNGDGGSMQYVAFEWLETTLAHMQYRPGIRIYAIIKAVVKTVLRSCIILADRELVNTDYKPANILLSGVETNDVTAKVGDLGLVFRDGSRCSAQPYAMRAPEVWQGQPCTQPSQVWALAAMLLCWMKPGILGTWGCPIPMIRESWCIAKLMRLFPNWTVPHLENDVRQCEFNVARALIDDPPPALQEISVLEDELRNVDMPTELMDLLRLMLIVNSAQRPSATHVLASKEFLAFEKVVAGLKKRTGSRSSQD
ncbi:serine/threonine protein kinase [Emergomyces africanus]|uniref:Serine/threonine protein kinase n=1 Tax=Emergomyces africanus TaxID=1955775 RepID=A0A1B7NUE2_9EURO|nr:serine/threonine protein kinase [Emergomyces africanus]